MYYMTQHHLLYCIGYSQVHSGDNLPSSECHLLGCDYVISIAYPARTEPEKIGPSLHLSIRVVMRYRVYT